MIKQLIILNTSPIITLYNEMYKTSNVIFNIIFNNINLISLIFYELQSDLFTSVIKI